MNNLHTKIFVLDLLTFICGVLNWVTEQVVDIPTSECPKSATEENQALEVLFSVMELIYVITQLALDNVSQTSIVKIWRNNEYKPY